MNMSQLLTQRQAEELCVSRRLPISQVSNTESRRSHKAIIAYLNSTKRPSSVAAVRHDTGIGDEFDEATSKKYEGLLEKKWTSVVRLQKKACE